MGTLALAIVKFKCSADPFPPPRDIKIPSNLIPLLASVGGSLVTRTTSKRGFKRYGRALVTEDLLSEIGSAFAEVFDHDDDHAPNL